MTPCVTLWIGPALGRLERACFRSVLRQGHPLALYCYSVPHGVPENVEIRDAAEIISPDEAVRHGRGPAALFSNYFRYELQRRSAGTWVDADVYLLKPLDGERPYLFGYQDQSLINGAVLRLPPNAPLVAELLAVFDEQTVPSWLPWIERVRSRRRLKMEGRTGLASMPWGVAGPQAITALARARGLLDWALPRGVFYPYHYSEADWILQPECGIARKVGSETVSVHLWNEVLRSFKDQPAPKGSFLARIQAEGQ